MHILAKSLIKPWVLSFVVQVVALIGVLVIITLGDIPEMLGLTLSLGVWAGIACKDVDAQGTNFVNTWLPTWPSSALVLLFGFSLMFAYLGGRAELHFALASAFAHFVLYKLGSSMKPNSKSSCRVGEDAGAVCSSSRLLPKSMFLARDRSRKPSTVSACAKQGRSAVGVGTQENIELSTRTRRASPGRFKGDVETLMRTCSAGAADEQVCRTLERMAEECLAPLVPEVEIVCVPHGNLKLVASHRSRPEVDMVVSVDQQVLHERLTEYFERSPGRAKKDIDTLLPGLLQKTATKVFAERITFGKFWHSLLSGPEPMVMLLVPCSSGIAAFPIRINFTVNNPYPVRLSRLLLTQDECTRELMCLVICWARKRCISNMGKGQPHVYGWCLLVVHFTRTASTRAKLLGSRPVALFAKFLQFCSSIFTSSDIHYCISFSGKQCKACVDSLADGALYLEDMFEIENDLGVHLSSAGLERIREELVRAHELFARGDRLRLADLLERWSAPP